MDAIEQTLRRFLWSGSELSRWGSKVAWNDICKPKNEGGLGIRNLCEWNKASMMRHIWNLCSNSSSLWVVWCKNYLLKGKCFWEVSTPSDCSWTWRKLLKLREEAKSISKYKVGNGDSISLWYSNWHPLGPLIPKFGQRVAYDAGLSKKARVSQIILNGRWKWPYPCTWELKEIVDALSSLHSPNPQVLDEFIWTASRNGKYQAKATWNSIRSKVAKVTWHHLLWFPGHIPKHGFILWLAIRGRLNTKDKMIAWGMNLDPNCVLCGQAPESIDHLFFHCNFSAELRELVFKRCLLVKATQPWKSEVLWALGKFSGKSFASKLRKIAWAALVYHLWQERNARIFKNTTSSVGSLIQSIAYVIRTKLSKFPVVKDVEENVNICTNWRIPL